ncbi:MAG: enoyl-CoA hydratase/isomerase family protein [Deltaproteobacteria bacterium]
MSPSEHVMARIDGPVGWLIFNHPERNNALSLEMWKAMQVVLDHYSGNSDVRVVVVCGAGEKAFTAGADISEFDRVRRTPEQIAHYNSTGHAASRKLMTIEKPTIAMIRGWCMGGGVGVALACDLRIAAASARFAIPAAKLSIGYGWPGIKMIIDLVGPAFTREILFTGRNFTAAEAQNMGLINRVVADDELETFVSSYCDMMGKNAPLSIQATKGTVAELLKPAENIDYARCEELDARCYASEDYVEGRRAFLEKRNPVFRGK